MSFCDGVDRVRISRSKNRAHILFNEYSLTDHRAEETEIVKQIGKKDLESCLRVPGVPKKCTDFMMSHLQKH